MPHVPLALLFAVGLSSALLVSATPGPWSTLESRAAQSEATCTSDFAWMENSNRLSPCQVASQVNALCNNGDWNIPKLDASVNYQYPNSLNGTSTLCTCSWASYNLMSACMACQGFPEKIPSFSPYVSDCVGKLSDTYFPSNLTLPRDVLIPFWAGTNPTQWLNEAFSTTEARNIANQGNADLGSSPPASRKSTPVGAIVGGVIGGLVVIAAAAAVAFYILRKQRAHGSSKGPSSLMGLGTTHMRSTSDVTTKSMAYTTLSSTPMVTNPPTSPTVITHGTSSVRSMPFFSSVIGSSYSPSPPPAPLRQASPPQNREDIIVPFTLPPANDNPDRKQANGAYPIYDSPTAPPPGMGAMRIEAAAQPASPQRRRFNPPAYTETSPGDTSGSASGSRHRGKQGSTDTNHSTPSSGRTGAPQQQRPAHTPANSGSSIGQIGVASAGAGVGANVGIANALDRAEGAPAPVRPQVHGRQLSGNSRDDKRQPPGEFSASDIA
ncbi:unnamed protein product [Cyclocybe aegerita]|uniref:Transmembrane protein n=1 Tax=Cyclocybe aegerita TaxID=1973307 RepID=A0A8S0W1F3_CYCAE|nr:unnamed protein product [Cyclocybe aegerita]